MSKFRIQDFQFLLILALFGLLAGCQSFKPENVPEGIIYVQEKLDTALTGISTAYDLGSINRDRKNKLLDQWQVAKDASDAAIITYYTGGGTLELDNATALARALVAQLVAYGVLEDE